MRKSVFFDEESQKHLEYLDKKMNLKPNHSSVIRLALQRLYEEEMKKTIKGGEINDSDRRTDSTD